MFTGDFLSHLLFFLMDVCFQIEVNLCLFISPTSHSMWFLPLPCEVSPHSSTSSFHRKGIPKNVQWTLISQTFPFLVAFGGILELSCHY